mgnify:CR=1 FL=1
MKPIIAAAAVAVLLSACQPMPTESPRANAQLKPTQGNKTFGEATFEQTGDKVRVVVFVQGLKPGQEHGMHIHEAADCSGDAMGASPVLWASRTVKPAARSAMPAICLLSRPTRPVAPMSRSMWTASP